VLGHAGPGLSVPVGVRYFVRGLASNVTVQRAACSATVDCILVTQLSLGATFVGRIHVEPTRHTPMPLQLAASSDPG
jgi:hypothetical protein